ncbi:MAG: 50S ribosomal protein L13 [Bacteroidia bacterium]|nr:50S ribosomal protein L13 [Bacteroidia bacterium]MDW8333786.1 50S ribosomal protein L13 [Bacteroidia bacterium]
MDSLSYKTTFVSKHTSERKWYLIDATGVPLGRLASRIAYLLRGKHKPTFTPHADMGDCVVVVNAAAVVLKGKKWDDKQLVHYTGYPGGQRFRSARMVAQKNPAKLIEHAVRGMLPKNRLGRRQFHHLYVYADGQHPHQAQAPVEYPIKNYI